MKIFRTASLLNVQKNRYELLESPSYLANTMLKMKRKSLQRIGNIVCVQRYSQWQLTCITVHGFAVVTRTSHLADRMRRTSVCPIHAFEFRYALLVCRRRLVISVCKEIQVLILTTLSRTRKRTYS